MKCIYFMILVFLSFSYISASVWRTDEEVMALLEEWMLKHGKVYNALTEKVDRFEIFKENLRYIEEHNNLSNKTYKLGLNQFSDLTNEEFGSIYLGSSSYPIDHEFESDYYRPEVNSTLVLPASVDWRAEGALLPIKNQGSCGSCWAFSAIASVEALNYIKTGTLISLSEQMLVDCIVESGCIAGYFTRAFEFMTKYGIALSDDYPYEGQQGECQKKNIALKINGYKNVNPRDEGALLSVAATQVVSVSVKSSSKDFQHYSSGIFDGECGDKLDHSMNVVGYDTDQNGKDYWILRNSWGKNWGEEGYMKMPRNIEDSEGYCGLAIRPSFPIMNSANEELNYEHHLVM